MVLQVVEMALLAGRTNLIDDVRSIFDDVVL